MAKKCIDGFIINADSELQESALVKKYNQRYMEMLQDLAKTNKTFQNKVKKLRDDFKNNFDLK